jgi:hypothetical protein
LSTHFGDLGFTFSPKETGTFNQNDFVVITAYDGTTQEFQINDQSNRGAIQNFLKTHANPNLVSQKFGGSSVNYSTID